MADTKLETANAPTLPAVTASAAPLVPQKSGAPAAFKKGGAEATPAEGEKNKDEEKKEATPEEEAKIKAIANDLAKTGLDPQLAELFARALVMSQRNKQESRLARSSGSPAGDSTAFDVDDKDVTIAGIDKASTQRNQDMPHDGVIMGQDTAFIGARSAVKEGDNLYGPGVYKRNEQGQLEKVRDPEQAQSLYGDLKSQHEKVMSGDQKGQNLSFKDGTPTFTNLTDANLSRSRTRPDGSTEMATDLAGTRNPDAILKAGASNDAGAPKPSKPASPIDRENAEDLEEIVPDKYANASTEADELDGEEPLSAPAKKPAPSTPKALPAPKHLAAKM